VGRGTASGKCSSMVIDQVMIKATLMAN